MKKGIIYKSLQERMCEYTEVVNFSVDVSDIYEEANDTFGRLFLHNCFQGQDSFEPGSEYCSK